MVKKTPVMDRTTHLHHDGLPIRKPKTPVCLELLLGSESLMNWKDVDY